LRVQLKPEKISRRKLLIALLVQLVIGLIFFVPEMRAEALSGVPFSEALVFYVIGWLITLVFFLGDVFQDPDAAGKSGNTLN
jgi:hypothetical protein